MRIETETMEDEETLLTQELISENLVETKSSNHVDGSGVTALELRLDFRSIKRLENLSGYGVMRKLILNNNKIEEIRGLDTLKHLQQLNLSFNQIEKIQGLEYLTNLRTLSLFVSSTFYNTVIM